jgi:hypothetical protein
MSEPISGFQRWAQLMDRAARDEVLTPEEEAFCERFARDNGAAERELAAYAELGEFDTQGDDSRTLRLLVDGALQRLEAEDAERAVEEVRRFRLPPAPFWLVASGIGAALLAIGLLNRGELTNAAASEAQARTEASSSRPLTRAELVYASGQVNVEGKRATAGRVLLGEGTRIQTGDGVACVLIDSDINLCLAANSDMRLLAFYSPLRRVELGAGILATRLSTQPEGQNLTIVAGSVTSTAIGTAFSVEHTPGQPVVTTVLNGKVRVAHGAADRLVNAHERAHSADNGVQVNSLSRNEEASSWALLGPTMLWRDPVSATLELNGEPAGAEAWLDGQLIGRAPLSSLVPVGGHRLIVRKENQVLLDEELHWNAGEARSMVYRAEEVAATGPREVRRRGIGKKSVARSSREELSAKVLPEPPPVEPALVENAGKPTPAELLRSARRQVRDGQLRAAVATYESLRSTYAGSEEAHTVLVTLAQLQLTALHDPARSLQLLDTYLARGGTLSEEARLTRVHALRALHRSKEEAAAISEFLVKHPRSFEDSTLRARLTDLRAQH